MPNVTIEGPSARSLLIRTTVRGQALGEGTAFVVEHQGTHWLVTNRHLLSGRRSDTNEPMSHTAATPDEVTVFVHVRDKAGWLSWRPLTYPLIDGDGEPLWFEHADGYSIDVAALVLPAPVAPVVYHGYSLERPGVDVSMVVTTECWAIGFPFGRTAGGMLPLWTRANVASEPDVDFDDKPCMVIDARTRRGQSGSPVIFFSSTGQVPRADGVAFVAGECSRLLGVYSGRLNEESDLGIVWKLSAIRDVLEKGIQPQSN